MSDLVLPPGASPQRKGLHDLTTMTRGQKVNFLLARCQALEALVTRQGIELSALKNNVPHVIAGMIEAMTAHVMGGPLPTFPEDEHARRVVFEAWLAGLVADHQRATHKAVQEHATRTALPTADERFAQWKSSLALRILTGFQAPRRADAQAAADAARARSEVAPEPPELRVLPRDGAGA